MRAVSVVVVASAWIAIGCGRVGYNAQDPATMDSGADFGVDTGVDTGIDMFLPSAAAVIVTPGSSSMTTELGGTASFTVALATAPSGNVTIALSSNDTTEGTCSPTSLTFTSATWAAPQTVTVTGVDDFEADGSVNYAILFSAAVSSDLNYNGLVGDMVSLINIDNETAGVTVTPTSGLVTSERGDTATFSIVLNAEPANDVTISLGSDDTSEGTIDPALVTFTMANWNAPQIITITGVDDAEADGSVTYHIATGRTVSSDVNYSDLDVDDVTVSNTDDDSAGVTVTPTSGLMTSESGASDTFTVVLNTMPTTDVTINVASDDASEGTTDVSSLVFTMANWSSPQTVTVTGVDDAAGDSSVLYHVVLSAITGSDAMYIGVDPDDVTLTNIDNDTPGITVAPTTGLVTSESGTTAAFTVVLNTMPSTDVVINLLSDDLTEGTLSASALTFTSSNWAAPQEVTVTGVNDFVPDGDQVFHVSTTMDASSSTEYAALSVDDVTVTNNDNDTAGITVTPTSGLTTSEMGAFATFTMVLDTMPSANVAITLSVDDATEGHVTPSTVTFTRFNWAAPQTVTVAGLDDAIADGNQVYHVITAPAFSADADYMMLNPSNVTVTNIDNDSAGVTLTPLTGLTTDESGTNATFMVSLNAQPTGNVTIPFITDDATEGYAAPTSLTFTPFNWASPQSIVVVGVDDLIQDGNQLFHILTGPATSTDVAYSGLNAADVSVTNIDDDAAAIIFGTPFSPITNENGGATLVYIRLQTMPTADVTIGLSSDDTTEGTVSPSSVTFTPANWSMQRLITVVGVDDAVADGNIVYHAVTAPATSADPNYNGLDGPNFTLTNLDNDSPAILISPTSGLATTESLGAATFTIVLATMPTANVSIALSSDDTTEGTVSPASVMFTTGNWNVPQIVTITGVDDALVDGPQTYHIVTATATSTDANYNGRDSTNPTVINYDNEGPRFNIVPRSGLSGLEGYNPATYSVSLLFAPSADVTLTWHSSDTSEGDSFFHTMVFTPSNWSTPQTVPVYAARDEIDDGDQPYSMVYDPAVSTDPFFNGQDPGSVSLTSVDIDGSKAVYWHEQTVLATSEGGFVASFRVWLAGAPSGDVSMSVTSTNTLEGTVNPASLTFTTANWATPQVVTVTGVADAMSDGPQQYDVVLGGITSTDPIYNGMANVVIPFTNCDGVDSPFRSCLGQTSYPDFISNDAVSLPDSPPINLGSGDFTIEAWALFRPTQPDRFPTIVSKRFGAPNGIALIYCMWNCGSTFLIQMASINLNAGAHVVTDNVWKHYAIVRQGGTVRFYINSILEITIPGVGHDISSGGPLIVGNDTVNALQSALNGSAHSVRVWNTAHSQAEVRTDMWQAVPVGAVGAWPINDGAGQTVAGTAGGNGFLGYSVGVDAADTAWSVVP